MIMCPYCHKKVSNSYRNCPHCGADLKERKIQHIATVIIGCGTFLLLIGMLVVGFRYFEAMDAKQKQEQRMAKATSEESKYVKITVPRELPTELYYFLGRVQSVIKNNELPLKMSEITRNYYNEDVYNFNFERNSKSPREINCWMQNDHVTLGISMEGIGAKQATMTMAVLMAANERIPYDEAEGYAKQLLDSAPPDGTGGYSDIIQLNQARYIWDKTKYSNAFRANYPSDIPKYTSEEIEEIQSQGISGLNNISFYGKEVAFPGEIVETLSGNQIITVRTGNKKILIEYDNKSYPGVFNVGDKYLFVGCIYEPVEGYDGYVSLRAAYTDDYRDAYSASFESATDKVVSPCGREVPFEIVKTEESHFSTESLLDLEELEDIFSYDEGNSGKYVTFTYHVGKKYGKTGEKVLNELKEDKYFYGALDVQDTVLQGWPIDVKSGYKTWHCFYLLFSDECNVNAADYGRDRYIRVYGRRICKNSAEQSYFYVLHVEPSDYKPKQSTSNSGYSYYDSGDYNVKDYDDGSVFADDWWDEFDDSEDDGWGLAYDYWEEYH